MSNRPSGTLVVQGLYYYPVKSCGGTPLKVAELGPRGILHDREFVVIDPKDSCRTQRKDPLMALIRPHLQGDVLKLKAPGMKDIAVPIVRQGETRKATVWRDTCDAVDQGDAVAQWLSQFMKTESRLVRMADGFVRKVNPAYAKLPSDQVGFQDGYPFHLTTVESLREVNSRLLGQGESPVPMNRFRPSIVIAGAEAPFIEDTWADIRIGEIPLSVIRPCSRCSITATDQETSGRGEEPLRTLSQFRPVNEKGFPFFGQNLVHRALGTIRLNDRARVLTYKTGQS